MRKDTIMKPSSFKYLLLVFLSVFVATAGNARMQENTVDTILSDSTAGVQKSSFKHKYDHRVHRYRKAFSALIPTHNKLQFYGDMGLVSVGIGWDYGKRAQWETDLLFGIIPKYNSDEAKVTMTLKQTFIPWSVYLGKGFSIEPLTCGLYLNTVFNDEFWTHEPDRYPKGYYGFSTRVRIHIFLGQSFTYDIPHDRRFFIKAISAFYEVSSCDLYIISAFTNSYLKPKDYLRFSFGLKFQIF